MTQTDLSYEGFKTRRAELEAAYRCTAEALKAISGGGAMGLTPDAVKQTASWREASIVTKKAFEALRTFNNTYASQFKSEEALERASRRSRLERPQNEI